MRIVVNHLTRMQPGFICVAGIDFETKQHVRPVIGNRRMETWMLARNNGPFEIGAIVDLGATEYVGKNPEIEDYKFDWMRAALTDFVEPDRFWRMLKYVAQNDFESIFGVKLTRRETGSCGIEAGTGTASLGCLVPVGRPRLYTRSRDGSPGGVRMEVGDGTLSLDLSVADIRVYGGDHVTPDPAAVESAAGRLDAGVECILSVGLSRPYAKSESEAPLHWVQVNSIHLRDDPGWKLG